MIFWGHGQWLDQHGGRRPKRPEPILVSVTTPAPTQYRDNWDRVSTPHRVCEC